MGALADRTRRGICERLLRGEQRISEVAEPFLKEMSFPAVTKHLNVLERAGLILRRKSGRTCMISLQAEALGEAASLLEGLRSPAPSTEPVTAEEFEIGIND